LGRAERTGARGDRQGQAGPGHERRQAQRLQRGRLASCVLRAGRPPWATSHPRTMRTGRVLAPAFALRGPAGCGARTSPAARLQLLSHKPCLPAYRRCHGLCTPCVASVPAWLLRLRRRQTNCLDTGGHDTHAKHTLAQALRKCTRMVTAHPVLPRPAASVKDSAPVWRHGSAGRRLQRRGARTGPVIITTRAPGRTSRSTGRGGSARSACDAARRLSRTGR